MNILLMQFSPGSYAFSLLGPKIVIEHHQYMLFP